MRAAPGRASLRTRGCPRLRQPGSQAGCCRIARTGNRRDTMPESSFDELIEAMKAAAGILQQVEIPFVLGGGLSAWARGGPRSEHDVDFLVRPEDAEHALAAFDDAGWKTERP